MITCGRVNPDIFESDDVKRVSSLSPNNKPIYYMASSASGQDESNPGLWLATRAGKMELSCPLGTTRRIPQEKVPRKPYNKSFIDQVCSVKMAGNCPRSVFASLWTSTPSRSINTQEKNLANIQPSWPHTWSIHGGTTCRANRANFPPLSRSTAHALKTFLVQRSLGY